MEVISAVRQKKKHKCQIATSREREKTHDDNYINDVKWQCTTQSWGGRVRVREVNINGKRKERNKNKKIFTKKPTTITP